VIIILLLSLACVQSQPYEENLGTPVKSMTIWGRLLVRDPVTDRPVLYAGTYTGEGWARLIRYDYADNRTEYYDLPGSQGAYGLCEGNDGKIYIGTVIDGRIFSFDPVNRELTDHGSAAGEQYVWTLQKGPDGRIYGATYPNAKAVVLDPSDGIIRDLGRMHPTEMYCRDLAVADNGRVFCGIGSHADLVAYDPSTGERRSILPEKYLNNSFAYTVMSEGNLVYAFIHFDQIVLIFDADTYDLLLEVKNPEEGGGAYISRQYSGGPVLISGLPGGGYLRFNRTTLSLEPFDTPGYGLCDPGKGVAYIAGGQYFDAVNTTSGERLSRVDVSRDGEGMHIFSLGSGPDGAIYGGVYNLLHLFRYDPGTKFMEDLGPPIPGSSGEFYSFHTLGTRLYMASYTYSVLSFYEPSLPWNPGTSPESNPRKIGPVGEEQYRPPGLVSGADGRIYIGSLPAYGKMGGALSSYDPVSDSFEVHRHIIPNQSVVSLTTSQDGWRIYGGSSVSGGGGTNPIETEAHFFAWDISRGEKVIDIVPVPGASRIQSLATAGDGRIYGGAGGTLFVFDPGRGEVVYSGSSTVGDILRMIPRGDGLIYGISHSTIFSLRPMAEGDQRPGVEKLHPGGIDLAFGGDGRLYFSKRNDPDLYVLHDLPTYQTPASNMVIYEDGLQPGWWLKKTRGDVDSSSTERVDSGLCQRVDYDRYCQLQYYSPDIWGITPWNFDYLYMKINPGDSTISDIIVTKTGSGSTEKLSLVDDIALDLPANRWTDLAIPVTALGWVHGSRMESLSLTFLGSGTLYLDSIALVIPEFAAPLLVFIPVALWASKSLAE